MSPYHVALVGYGEQARRFYHPVLEELSHIHPLRLTLVVDLADRAEAVRGFLARRQLQPERLLLLDPAYRSGGGLAPQARAELDALHARGELDRLLVITEPKAHKPYVLWGTEHDVDVLCEKPLTAVEGLSTGDEETAWQLAADWLEVARSVRAGRVVLMAPRRVHTGFTAIVDHLRDFVDRFEVPVTYVDACHAEGVWNMPDEFLTRENHPYRYGYGKLLHSGYHYVELAMRIAQLNARLPGKAPDCLSLTAQAVTPPDFFAQFDDGRYRELLHTDRFAPILSSDPAGLRHLGETDVQVMGQFSSQGRVLTSLLLSMLHTSVNNRSWNELPTDLWKNGRRPHERVVVHVGHLLTLEMSSRYTAPDAPPQDQPNPFVIGIHRNTGVVGGVPFEEIRPGGGNAAKLAEAARREILRCWLNGAEVDSELSGHGAAIRVLSGIYASLARRRVGRDGLVRLGLAPEHSALIGNSTPGLTDVHAATWNSED